VLPAELKGWNWGAFFWTWVWGIGNGTYIALLALIPFVGWVMMFVLGAKGNAWAWQNKRWDNSAHFKRVQRIWRWCALGVYAGFIIIALLVIASLTLTAIPFGRGAKAGTGSSDRYVAGVGEQHPVTTRNHIPDSQTARYSTTPPTSGDHWARWADCGFYPEGLPDERITHNLEHSNIVVSYNLTAQEEVAQLRKVLGSIDLNPIWGVTRFHDKLEPGTVAVATWGVLDIMKGIDRDRIKKFFETYSGKLGPEQFPC